MSWQRHLMKVIAACLVTFAMLVAGGFVASASSAQPAAGVDARVVVLLLDTSGSMTDEDIASAREASREFVMALPADVQVGLITFAEVPKLVVKPTTDSSEIARALSRLRQGANTSLYDALELGVSTLQEVSTSGDRRLVVLSDGEDTNSAVTLDRARRLLVDSKVAADFVAYRYGSTDTDAMKRLAAASGGRVLKAESTSQLADAFTTIARAKPNDGVAPDNRPAWLSWLAGAVTSIELWVVLVLTFGAVLVLGLAVMLGAGKSEDTGAQVLKQIDRYGPRRVPSGPHRPNENPFARNAVTWTEDILRSRGWEEKLAERLDLASIKMKPAEWTLMRVFAAVVATAVLTVVGLNFFISAAVGALLGSAGGYAVVQFRISKRRKAFGEQLPDVLQLVAGSLQSGFSLAQALDSVVREGTEPAATEISRALAESRLGVELEDGLEHVASRMASDDLRWVIMAIRIQREVGGNLAEVLLTTVATMRERVRLRGQVRALSAEGRLSAYILLGLPVVLAALLFTWKPDYMRPLYTTGIGIVLLGASVIGMIVGSFWMSRLVKVEV